MCKLLISTFIVLQLYVECHSNHLSVSTSTDHVNNVLLGRFKRQYSCKTAGKFQCSSGQCISQNSSCDGVKDCIDGSDETAELCKNIISSTLDNKGGVGCVLPAEREKRKYCTFQCNDCLSGACSYAPGSKVRDFVIKVQCEGEYRSSDNQDFSPMVCINGSWISEFPKCQKTCPPLASEFLEINCFYGSSEKVDCSQPMRPGSSAKFQCRPSYKEVPYIASAGIYKRSLLCRDFGTWTGSLPICEPNCGVSKGIDPLTPKIVNGTASKLEQFPWHAALYKRNRVDKEVWDNVCAGSLISQRVVLTAAHCVKDFITRPTDLRVALGKHFRDWASEEKDAIRRDVISIKFPPEYQGIGVFAYAWNIALIFMNATVQFNSVVMPVCMNLDRHLTDSVTGYVVLWGKTGPNNTEQVPLYRNITIMAEDCQSNPDDIYFDKLCNINDTAFPMAWGDAGVGLYVIDSGLHYIYGLGSHNYRNMPKFTNISWDSHKRWITNEISTLDNKFGSSCVLPAESENRNFCTLQCTDCGKGACSYAPGSKISDYVIKVQCERGYRSSDNQDYSTMVCINGNWNQEFPQCQKSSTFTTLTTDNSSGCSLPENPSNRLFCPYTCRECSLNPLSACAYPSPNVQAIKVQCTPGYGMASALDLTFCINNTWVPSLPECQKVCPPLASESLEVTCFNEFTDIDCSQPMLPGSTAKYQCRTSHREISSFTSAGIYKKTLICKRDGMWTGYLPECEPICGVSKGNETLTPTIVNGTATKLGQFPWHAALYKRNSVEKELWDNICGGSLISHHVVMTAAHCVAGIITTPADLRVALGKYFRDWAKEEKYAVRRDIVFIKLPPAYRGGATSYTWDVALLLMNATVQFNSFIMPVCMNLEAYHPLYNGDNGYVVGWGKTAPNGIESEVLLYNNITIMAEEDCQRSIALFLSFDKFCGIRDAVSVVQQGDSGGGLTAIFGGLHYIIGVVSIKSKEIPMFTNISWRFHRTWINREMLDIVNLN